MRSIYAPIRALGDFIITASVVKNNFLVKVPILLPDFIADLFYAIEGDKYFDIEGTIGFSNQPAFFEMYKVKDLKNLKRLWKDIKIIKHVFNSNDQYLLDYSSRRLFFTRAKLVWPPTDENIYEGKAKLLAENSLIKPDVNLDALTYTKSFSNILIIPDSRVKEKNINNDLIKKIKDHFKGLNIQIARFSQKKADEPDHVNYSNFKELMELISSSDLIISAESLPYHLAYFLGKPHFVIYNESRHFKTTFMTPFMLRNNYFSIFTGSNHDQVISQLEKVLPQHGNDKKHFA